MIFVVHEWMLYAVGFDGFLVTSAEVYLPL